MVARGSKSLPDGSSEVTLEAAKGLDPRLALGLLAGEELARSRMDPALGNRDPVKGAVELAVAAAVEAVAGAVSLGGGDRGDAGEAGELCIRVEALDAGGLGEDLGGA